MRCTVQIMLGITLLMSGGYIHAQNSSQANNQNGINRMIPLLEQGLPIFGLPHVPYAPDPRGDGDVGDLSSIAEAARETVDYALADYVRTSYSPETVEQYRDFLKAISDAGGSAATHPFMAKIPIVHDNEVEALRRMTDQLNEGQVMVAMQEVESVEEVERTIAAMRFTSNGGTRSDTGFSHAAAYWRLTEEEYKEKADVWPLDPDGELLLNVIIESREGVANARAIAAVPGVAVVMVGPGTLSRVFLSTNEAGERVWDQAGFDEAVAKILAACKSAGKACGYTASNPEEIEALMAAGWDFFLVIGRDQDAFNAIAAGRRIAGRPIKP